MASLTQDYLGRLTNRLSQVFLENVGIGGVPLSGCTTGFPDADSPNSITTISLMLENVKGRTAQRLLTGTSTPSGDPNYRVYSKYEDPGEVTSSGTAISAATIAAGAKAGPDDYGKAVWQQFKVRPDNIEEGMYEFTLADLENLNDDAFIRNIVQSTLFETVRRRVMMRFYETLFDPYYYVSAEGSSTSGGNFSLKVNGTITDYDDLSVHGIDRVHVQLRKRLLNKIYEGGNLKLIGTPDLYAGISAASPNLNWANTYGSLKNLESRTYGKIKNVEIHEADFVDVSEDIQHDGIPWTNRGSAPVAGNTIPHLNSVTDTTKFTFAGTTAFASGERLGQDNEAPATTLPIVGAVFNKRAIGMGLWNRWEASRFAGNPLGTVTSFFTDPLSGVTFRLETYYQPTKQNYRIVCSAKVGFVKMDFRACELILYKASA